MHRILPSVGRAGPNEKSSGKGKNEKYLHVLCDLLNTRVFTCGWFGACVRTHARVLVFEMGQITCSCPAEADEWVAHCTNERNTRVYCCAPQRSRCSTEWLRALKQHQRHTPYDLLHFMHVICVQTRMIRPQSPVRACVSVCSRVLRKHTQINMKIPLHTHSRDRTLSHM